MNGQNDAPESIVNDLRRYLEIQNSEAALKEEKSALQERLGRYMAGKSATLWMPEVDGQSLKVRRQSQQIVEYDEEVLRRRLGARYLSILAPDPKKIRAHLDELAPVLTPYLDRVGSPQPQTVRAAIEQGLVSKDDFAGAFRKEVRERVAVMKLRPGFSGREPDNEDIARE